uniref:40S ribosomal protein S6-like n=1 Tax=Phallusia mammillata TaxID=59560 RepID=A0A6F9DS91_9ASCI|nr:40S ribosomal protein S6-like [Phallusia mammillata]
MAQEVSAESLGDEWKVRFVFAQTLFVHMFATDAAKQCCLGLFQMC